MDPVKQKNPSMLLQKSAYSLHFFPKKSKKDEGGKSVVSFSKNSDGKISQLVKILEESPDFISMAYPDEKIWYVNKAGKKLLKLKKETPHKIEDFHPRWAYELIKIIAIPKAMKHGMWVGETAFLRSDGKEIPASQIIMCHRDSEGEIEYFSTICRDISKEVELDEKKDEFIAMASHELKMPITNALTSLYVLEKELKKIQENGLIDQVQKLRRHLTQLTELMNGLLDVSKIQLQRMVPSMSSFDLTQVIHEIIQEFQPSFSQKIEFFRQNETFIEADRYRIKQMLVNLLTNASKYSPSSEKIEVRLRKGKGQVVLEVQDYGIGIPKKDLPNIFDKYFTSLQRDSGIVSGLGLGLFIVKEVVKMHKGGISVHSQMKDGTTFVIKLPVKQHLS